MVASDAQPRVTDAEPEQPVWALAVFASRETLDTAVSCLEAAFEAARARYIFVDVLINGNKPLADAMSGDVLEEIRLGAARSATLRLWFSPRADKANAWNGYVHQIWPEGADCTFFIDGYAWVAKSAFKAMAEMLAGNEKALAVSGVPSEGRSAATLAKRMRTEGGIHGNLYAIGKDTMRDLRRRDIRLPVGLYRTDATLGAVLAFGLDPARGIWDISRIAVCGEATWSLPPPVTDGFFQQAKTHLKRRVRQARGAFENKAIEHHLRHLQRLPEAWPEEVKVLIFSWMAQQPVRAGLLMLRQPVGLFAIMSMRNTSAAPANFSLIREKQYI